VRVTAYNIYGDSLASDNGLEAILVTYPDPPTNIIENVSQRGVTWSIGTSNGGTSIIDYTLYHDQGTDNYVVVGTTVLKHLIATGLTNGITYKFYVTARNSYGTSETTSLVTEVLCASVPDAPSDITTVIQAPDSIVVQWSIPASNGVDLTEYQVYFRKQTDDYSLELVYCDGASSTVFNTQTCTMPVS
jgi:hypothetical protein